MKYEITSPGFFYLQDETGRLLVDPAHAALQSTLTQASDWARIGPLLSLWGVSLVPTRFSVPRIDMTEVRIPPETPIYALGELSHREEHLEDRQQRFNEHLRHIKTDQNLMARADSNRDVVIDPQEWDVFRDKQEALFLADEAKRAIVDSVILRAPERGGFVISMGSLTKADADLSSNASGGIYRRDASDCRKQLLRSEATTIDLFHHRRHHRWAPFRISRRSSRREYRG